MALTRKFLQGLGLTEAQVEAVVEGNEESLKGLKDTISDLKDKETKSSEELAKLQKELEDAKNLAIEKEGKNPWKVKFDALKEEFEGYKTEEQKKATKAAKESAYKALLKETGVAEKRIASVVRVSDIESLELGDDGKFKNSDELVKKIKEDWSDFISTESTKGADTATPPANNGSSDDDGDSAAVKSVIAQRAAMYGANKE